MSYIDQIKIFLNITLKDLYVIKKDLLNTIIDALAWPTVAAIVFGYIMPKLNNVPENYGAFVLIGAAVTVCMITGLDYAYIIVNDFEDTKLVNFYLSTPIKPSLIFIQKAFSIAIKSCIYSIPIFIWGKVVLLDKFSYEKFSLLKFLLLYPIITIFVGFFCMWVVSWVKNYTVFVHVWMRLYNPMMWFGGQMFSFYQIKKIYPFIAYLMLINPITYCVEGVHSVFLGQDGFLNFWICVAMLSIFTIFMATVSTYKLNKRLDCV